MFLTHKNAETPMGAWLDDRSRSWRFVEWSVNSPWLWVTTIMQHGSTSWANAFMICEPEDILSLTAEHSNELKKIDVQLVSPSWMNQSGGWLMEPLAEIITGTVPNLNYQVRIFSCLNGSEYVDSPSSCDTDTLQNRRVLFAIDVDRRR